MAPGEDAGYLRACSSPIRLFHSEALIMYKQGADLSIATPGLSPENNPRPDIAQLPDKKADIGMERIERMSRNSLIRSNLIASEYVDKLSNLVIFLYSLLFFN
uniref:Uncharacterized protein n=1 Tax=Kalanchoe fedtschenkoi TaxID=63787 RepID=A0A7N0V9Z7_KALFE